uniref:PHD-type domain-containing protein n=1 Tax=Cacopsylla melanoneura TaxID=428564 RepID=A0A8D8U173_9HEMI
MGEDDCGECSMELPVDGDFASCSQCKKGYHFDCTTISESSWRSYGAERRKGWKCAYCSDKNRKIRSTQATKAGDGGDRWDEVFKRFDDFETKIDKKLKDFEDNLNFYGEKVEMAAKTMKELEQKLVMMEKRLEKTEGENKELKTRVRSMEIQMNELDQKDYNNKIEITGIKNVNVNVTTVVETIFEKAGITSGEIQHREEKVTKGSESSAAKTSIVVHFKSQDERNKALGKMKTQKVYMKLGSSVNQDSSYVFINEALCPAYKKLFYEVNRVKKDKRLAFLWVKDGKILLKKTENSSVLKISCGEDLGKI